LTRWAGYKVENNILIILFIMSLQQKF